MKAMKFPVKFINWILLLHKGATTCFLLNFTTASIPITFSVRQGDPVAMCLYLIFIEPLLLRLHKECPGVILKGRLLENMKAPLVEGVEEELEGYVDDVEALCSSDNDFLIIDRIVGEFESVSGAILNRSTKSVVLGLGGWKNRSIWPLRWLKTVDKIKVFGFFLHNDYKVIIEENWSYQLSKFSSTLFSWSSRVVDSLLQRAEIISLFALSKVWYRAQVLPLPNKFALKFEKQISEYLWKGQITRNVLSKDTVCLPKGKGGLALPHLRLKCRSLFVKQIFRNIFGRGNGKNHVDFWLGERLGIPGLGSQFFHLKGRPGAETDATPDLFKYTLKCVNDLLEGGTVSLTEIQDITTKQLYLIAIDVLPAPVIVERHPDRDWRLTWERLHHGSLTPQSRSFLYLIVHERVGTRERGNRLMPGRFPSPLCPNCSAHPETIGHRYIWCDHVNQTWEWLRNILNVLDPSLVLHDDKDILKLDFSKGMRENAILWLVGIYITLVEREAVLKHHILDYNSSKGYFKQMKQMATHMAIPDLGTIPGIDWEPQGVG